MRHAALLALLGLVSCAAPPPAWRPAIDRLARPAIQSGRFMALVVGVVQGSRREILAYGTLSESDLRAPDGRTLFEIGSITKTFTAALLAEMADRGEVALDDPVRKFLPPEAAVPQRNGREIALVNLATHTSGLPRLPDDFFPNVRDAANPYAHYGPAELYASLRTQKLLHDIGAKYDYSNLGAGLLGHALARRLGTSYEEALRSRVLEPLGMRDTAIRLSDDQKKRLAPGHGEEGEPVAGWDLNAVEGAGALRSTSEDMLLWLEANLRGKPPFLASTHRLRHEEGGLRIGLAWHLAPLGRKGAVLMTHSGGTGGYRSFVAIVKERDLALVVLSNTSGEIDPLALSILQRLLR